MNIKEKVSAAQIVDQSPIGIVILRGDDYIVELVNDFYLEIVGRNKATFLNRALFDSMPELQGQGVKPLLDGVMLTGLPYFGNEFHVDIVRKGRKEAIYVNFVYQPLRNNNNIVDGIIVVATDVTAQVTEAHALRETERQFHSLLLQTSIAMGIFRGRDLRVALANPALLEIWQREAADVTGKKLLDLFPELKDQRFEKLLEEVYDTGKPYSDNESMAYVNTKSGMLKYYLNFTYAPLFAPDGKTVDGIIITVHNVTEQVESRRRIEESEQRLRMAIEATQLGTFDINISKDYEAVFSKRLKEIFGKSVDAHVPRSEMFDQLHPDDVAMVREAHRQSLKTGKLTYEARILHADDTVHWIGVQGEVLYNKQQEPTRLLGTVMDITDDKRLVASLRESEERFRNMADTAPVMIWVADTTSSITFFNKQWLTFTGRTMEEEAGDGWTNGVHREDFKKCNDLYIRHFNAGTPFYLEYRLRRHDGVYRWIADSGVPRYTPEGIFEGYIGSCMDIQDRKMAEEEMERIVTQRTSDLKDANDLLEKSNQQLEQFAYVSSHDLQEPLRKIQTFSDLVLKKIDDPSFNAKTFLEKIISSARRMSVLIEDLLNFSRINNSQEQFAQTDLNKVLENVSSDFEVLIKQKNAIVTASRLPSITAIPIQMNQLFFNLVGNALKFSEKDAKVEINARALTKEDLKAYPQLHANGNAYTEIVFKDNGIGFDQSYAEQIFTIFQRLNDRQQYSGTGIGLAVCRKIVENHKGIILAEGKRGVGAKFTIVLPV